MMQAFLYRHLVTAQQLLVQVAEPEPATVALNLPADGIIRARPGSEVTLGARVIRNANIQGTIKLTLSDPPEWLTLATGSIDRQGGEIILKISPNAEPGNSANVLLNGTVRVAKSARDPDYNPVMKNLNTKTTDFTIDAISIQIIN